MSFGEPIRPTPILSSVPVKAGSEDEQRPGDDGTLAQQAEKTRAMAERTAVHRANRRRRQMRLVPADGLTAATGRELPPRAEPDWSFLTSEPYQGTWGRT